jgi:hypothetical protein
MPLKAPPPLTDKEWNDLIKQLEENNNNPICNKRLKKAIDNAKKIKEYL